MCVCVCVCVPACVCVCYSDRWVEIVRDLHADCRLYTVDDLRT